MIHCRKGSPSRLSNSGANIFVSLLSRFTKRQLSHDSPSVGDTDYRLGIESVSKVPTAILAMNQYSAQEMLDKIGADGLNPVTGKAVFDAALLPKP